MLAYMGFTFTVLGLCPDCPVIWSDPQIDCMFHQSMFSSGACCSVSEPCFHMGKLSLSREFTVQTSLGCPCWWALSPNLTPASWWPRQWTPQISPLPLGDQDNELPKSHPCHLVTKTMNSPNLTPATWWPRQWTLSSNLTPATWWPRQWTLPKSHPCHLVTKTVNSPQISPLPLGDKDNEPSPNLIPAT